MEKEKLIKVTSVKFGINYITKEYDPGKICLLFETQVAASWFVHSLMLVTENLDNVYIEFEDFKRCDFENGSEWVYWLGNADVYSSDDVLKEDFVYRVIPNKWYEATAWEFSDE